MDVSFQFDDSQDESPPNAPPLTRRCIPHSSMRRSSQKSVDTRNSSSTVSFRDPMSVRAAFHRRTRRLIKLALGDLKEDSDAPPAVRLLAATHNQDEEEEEDVDSLDDDEDEYGDGDGTNMSEKGILPETAAPTPRDNSRSQHPREDWVVEKECKHSVPFTHPLEVKPYSSLTEFSRRCMDGSLATVQEASSVTGSPALLSIIPRTISSYSSSKLSMSRYGVRHRSSREEVVSTEVSCGDKGRRQRRHTFCCQRLSKFPLHVSAIQVKRGDAQKSRSGSSTPPVEQPPPLFFFEPLGLLQSLGSVVFTASYPPPRVPPASDYYLHINRRGTTEEITPMDEETHEDKEAHNENEDDALSPLEANRVKLTVPFADMPRNPAMKAHGSESCFSLSTPRRQSTNSSPHYSSANTLFGTLHQRPQSFRWNIQAHQQLPQASGNKLSCSRASPEKTPRSPMMSSTLRRQWHASESLEWLQQHFVAQQGHTCHLPVFASGTSSPTPGANGGTPLPPRTNGMLGDNTSVSSLLLTRTTSNIDVVVACYDAPLDALMESSTFTTSSTVTTTQ